MYAWSLPWVASAAGVLLLVIAVIAVRNRVMRRMALRNVIRRPGEAALVVVGSLLGTAIIVGSFAVGDSLRQSAKADVYNVNGPVDEQVVVPVPTDVPSVEKALEPVRGDARVDGYLVTQVTRGGVAKGEGFEARAEPEAGIYDMAFSSAHGFGGIAADTGIPNDGPGSGEVVITSDLADRLGASRDDAIQIYTFGTRHELRVASVIDVKGLAGYAGLPTQSGVNPRGQNVFVEPGLLQRWWQEAAMGTASRKQAPPIPPTTLILVSNKGDVEGGDRYSDEVGAEIKSAVEPLRANAVVVEIVPVKQISLQIAKAGGDNLGQVFLVIGSFSVIAGILLLVNIFVMLAEERKTELGMLRAVGMTRSQLVREFAVEGSFYALEAALLGAATGVIVGRAIVAVASSIFAGASKTVGGLSLSYAITWKSVALGVCIGFLMSLITIAATSLRIARINIIRAIRDLPEPKAKRGWPAYVGGVLLVLMGASMAMQGLQEKKPSPSMMGPALVLFGIALIASRFLNSRLVYSICSAGVLAWVILVDPLFGVMKNGDNPDFVVMGMLLAFSAAILVSENQTTIAAILRRMRNATSDTGLALRIGLANPIAHKFRTGMTLVMFSLVIFTLVVIASFARMQSGFVGSLAAIESGGYQIMATTLPANPIVNPEATLAGGPVGSKIDAVTAMPVRYAPVTPPDPSKVKQGFRNTGAGYPIWGVNDEFVNSGALELRDKSAEYTDDAQAWRAVLDDPSLAIVDGAFLNPGGGPVINIVQLGDTVVVTDPGSGRDYPKKVIGFLRAQSLFRGFYVGKGGFNQIFGEFPSNKLLIKTKGAEEVGEVAASLSGAYLANGMQARVFKDVVDEEAAINFQFIRLMQGYLGLGLVVGVAGLGVLMVRAVRERRRQIGVLRALGVSSRVVGRSFIAESAFIATEGIVAGTLLGLLTSYNIFRNTIGQQISDLSFSAPLAEISILLVITMVASLLFTLLPARRAAQIDPAVALRLAE